MLSTALATPSLSDVHVALLDEYSAVANGLALLTVTLALVVLGATVTA
jgi:hypothetical protein